jgi:hypothetical protein
LSINENNYPFEEMDKYLKRKRDDSADDDHDGECEEGLRLPNAL